MQESKIYSFERFPFEWRRNKLCKPYEILRVQFSTMFLTNVLLKKVKAKHVMVCLRSTGSCHTIVSFRERLAGKKEIIFFDPYIGMECVYKEEKKIKSMKRPLNVSKQYNESTYGIIPKELLELESSKVSETKKTEG